MKLIIVSYICIFIIICICAYTNGNELIVEVTANKCYKCLKENQICQNIINDESISLLNSDDGGNNGYIDDSNIIYQCIDGLNCISDISMPSMHPNRTSSCGKSNKYLEFCEPGRELSCGLSMWCDSHDDNLMSQCKGFRSLQFNEQCTSDSQCDSMQCSSEKGYCLENEYSCRPNWYWNGTNCTQTNNTGDHCISNDQCSLFNTCNNGICIEKYSLQKYNSCTSNSSCDISNQLICIKGICDSFTQSTTTNCLKDGCNSDNEYCDCKTLKCSKLKVLNQECKSIENQLDHCIDKRCIYSRGFKSSDSCIMKYCGKLICEYHTNCTNSPCGDNIEYCQSKDNYIPNNQVANFNNNDSDNIYQKENGIPSAFPSTSLILKSTIKFTILLICIINIII